MPIHSLKSGQGFPLSGEREGGYWIGGDAYTAVAVAKKVGTGAWTVYNIFRDHLGTITHLKTGTSTAVEYSFDAWGRRRSADDWSYALDVNDLALFADRGFTGHEYLSYFNLYNMNGRLYDPLVGRFLSADPYVQNAGLTQSYNRYSYCLNNPLRYTDPTGEKIRWPKFEWRYLIPVLGQLEYVMQTINDNTTGLRNNMSKAGIPPLGFGVNVNLAGNVNANANVNGQQVLNTQNIDRSGPSVKATNKMLMQVRQDYGKAWHAASNAWNWTKEHFYVGAEGEITYGVQLALTLKNGLGLNLSPFTEIVTEGKINNSGKIATMDSGNKLKIKDFGAAYYIGVNYYQTIDAQKMVN